MIQQMQKYLKSSALFFGVIVAVGGCGQANDPRLGVPLLHAGEVPGYQTVKTFVFEPHCIRCHGNDGGVNLESYQNAKRFANAIKRDVVFGAMPPSGGLSAEQTALVVSWVDGGAPETDQLP
ncbi:MAG: hypothetical protein KDD51_08315 [Bdellovibrionales bacterium]|nr:hypothetical protein [Bdellovibrionales bacterium]